jgi:altronate dehydratase small subunit
MSKSIDPKVWIIAPQDNVGTVVGGEGRASQTLPMIGATNGAVELKSPIPHGHKVALTSLAAGAEVVKYGVVIGRLVRAVAAGEHVHTHNLESLRGRGDQLASDERSAYVARS